MKLLFLIDSLAIEDGGPPRALACITHELAKRYGDEVTIASGLSRSREVEINPHVTVSRIGQNRTSPLEWGKAAARLTELISMHDCLFVSGIWGPFDGLALSLARWQGKPVFIRTCGMLEDYILQRNRWKKRLARFLYVDRNLRRAVTLIANTELEKKQIHKAGFSPTSVTLIPNGVELSDVDKMPKREARSSLDIPSSGTVLLYLSRLHRKKGFHLLVQAFARFLAQRRGWTIVAAGTFSDESYKREIHSLIDTHNLHSRIVFLGEVSGARKAAAFSSADLFVLPSYSEGFSNAILEAMAYELPVLITPGCNFPEVAIRGAGMIVEPNVEEILDGLMSAEKIQNDLQSMGKKGKELIKQNFESGRVAAKYRETAQSFVHSDDPESLLAERSRAMLHK